MPVQRTLRQDFFSKWSREMAYVLGYFAADGSMIENERGGQYIEFTSTDLVLLKLVQQITGSNHTITQRERGGNTKTAYRLQIGSKQWFSDLVRLRFSLCKSKTLLFPHIPIQYLGDFVRGYFDGEGCVYLGYLKYADRKNKRWVLQTLFTSGSQSFLAALHNILCKQGIQGGSLVSKNRGFELKFSHKDSIELYRVMYHNAQTKDMCLPRKREKLEKAMKLVGKMRA